MRAFYRTLALALIVLVGPAYANIGGGSGRPITPYGHRDPTLAEVRAQMDKQSHQTMVEDVSIVGTNDPAHGSNIGFLYTFGQVRKDDIAFSLSGYAGKMKISLPLANITEITIVRIEAKGGAALAVLQVEEMPDVDPEVLMKAKPTYKDVVRKFSRRVVLSVPLKSPSGMLSIVGTSEYDDPDQPTNYRILFRLDQLIAGRPIRFKPETGEFWYAVPSVTGDPSYPFRRHFMM